MRVLYAAALATGLLAVTSYPAMADETTIVVEPEAHSWVMEQPDSGDVTYQGDVAVGEALPDDVQVLEVPRYKQYRYVILNKHRVLIDANTRKIIAEY